MSHQSNDAERNHLAPLLVNAGVFLVVVFFLPGLAHPFNVPKESLVALLSGFTLFVVATGRRPSINPWPSWWSGILLAPVLIATIAALFNGAGLLASDGTVRLWCYAAFLLSVRLGCGGLADVERLVRLATALGGLEGAVVVFQVLAGHYVFDTSGVPSAKWRAFGTLGNPNWVRMYLAATPPLAAGQGRSAASTRERVWWILMTGATVAGLIVTLSRGAWSAAGAGVIGLVVISPRQNLLPPFGKCRGDPCDCPPAGPTAREEGRNLDSSLQTEENTGRWRVIVTASVLAGAFAAAVVWASFGRVETLAAVTRTASIAGRMRIWEISASVINARPVLGWGPGRFAAAYPAFQRAYTRRRESAAPITDLPDHPHSEYFSVGVEAGVPGLFALLAVLALVLRRATADTYRKQTGPLAAAVIALAVHSLGDLPLHLPATTALFCLLVVAILTAAIPSDAPSRRLTSIERAGLLLVAGLAVGQATRLLLVDRWLQESRRALDTGNAIQAQRLCTQALRLEPTHGELCSVLAHARVVVGDDAGALQAAAQAQAALPTLQVGYLIADIEQRQGRPEGAAAVLQEWSETLPGLLRPRVLLSETYAETGQVEAAKTMLAEVMKMPAKFPTAEENELHTRAARLLQRLEEQEKRGRLETAASPE